MIEINSDMVLFIIIDNEPVNDSFILNILNARLAAPKRSGLFSIQQKVKLWQVNRELRELLNNQLIRTTEKSSDQHYFITTAGRTHVRNIRIRMMVKELPKTLED